MAFYSERQFRLNQTHHIRDIKRYWSSQFSDFWSFCPNLFAFYTLLLSLLSFGWGAARDTSDKMHRWQFHKKALLGFPDIWRVLLLLFCTTIIFWPVFGFIHGIIDCSHVYQLSLNFVVEFLQVLLHIKPIDLEISSLIIFIALALALIEAGCLEILI